MLAVTLHLPGRDCEAAPWSCEILNQPLGVVVDQAVTYSRPAREKEALETEAGLSRGRGGHVVFSKQDRDSPNSLLGRESLVLFVSDASTKGPQGEGRASTPILTS